jgi:hypothetical protein
MKNYDSSDIEKKNTSNKKTYKTKHVIESENNLHIVKLAPKQSRKASTKFTSQSNTNTYDFYDDETQDTDDSLYLPNFAKNFDGKFIY